VIKSALESLALPAPPDGIVFMALVKTVAYEKAGNVDWDGAQQSALTLGPAISRSAVSAARFVWNDNV
jgi:hypothetical protein